MTKDTATNRDFASSNLTFRAACDEENIEPTKRQAGKWRRGMGRAWLNRTRNIRKIEDMRRETESTLFLASTTPTTIEGENGEPMDGPPDQQKIDSIQQEINNLNRRISLLKGGN